MPALRSILVPIPLRPLLLLVLLLITLSPVAAFDDADTLDDRRHGLEPLLSSLLRDGALRYSESFSDPERLLAAAHDLGLEAVVSKRRATPYRSGRRPEWVKVKTENWRIANGDRWRLFDRGANSH